MEDYNPANYKTKEDRAKMINNEKRIEKPIISSGAAKIKKKNDVQKFADVFISEDVSNVKSYILMDVLVPAIKKAISDIVTNGIDMILYGESGRTRKGGTNASKVSYRAYYDQGNDRRRDYNDNRSRGGFDYDNVEFRTRGEAEAVLSALDDAISQYGIVSVGDFYDVANISVPDSNYTVNKYGWRDIRSAHVVRSRDGYMIKFPKAMPLD